MAYMPGDGMLNFEDSIRTVGELKSAIESALGLPTFKQRIFTSGGRLCEDDSAILEAHKENPDGGHKMFMLVDRRLEAREAEKRRRKKEAEDFLAISRETVTAT